MYLPCVCRPAAKLSNLLILTRGRYATEVEWSTSPGRVGSYGRFRLFDSISIGLFLKECKSEHGGQSRVIITLQRLHLAPALWTVSSQSYNGLLTQSKPPSAGSKLSSRLQDWLAESRFIRLESSTRNRVWNDANMGGW